jgi:adenosylcobyric acid synthase
MGALMIQGVSSGVGKSLITTAIARAFHRRGIDTAPFKAQNISNNSRVVEGGEIGAAQYMQALAACLEPDVRMNPVLIKPESAGRSEVVVLGKRNAGLSRLPWHIRSDQLWTEIEGAMTELAAAHDVLLIEGAGSPAEPNLHHRDVANMRTALCARARVFVVADVERGGAFAHLYGTWLLLDLSERAHVYGFVLNKSHGDPALLDPAPSHLERLTGVPTIGVMPWLAHGLPDEDGAGVPTASDAAKTVAIVRYPTASNLDEFKGLQDVANVRWATVPTDLTSVDLVVLPGSKHVTADLRWLKRSGLADALLRRAAEGRRIMGVCGGMQMLGARVEDETRTGPGEEGLGLLPLETAFGQTKHTERTTARFEQLPKPWTDLGNRTLAGYQIRRGRTDAVGPVRAALPDDLGYVDGPVLGIYLHGFFENAETLSAVLGDASPRSLDRCFDELADALEAHVDVGVLVKAAIES